ncbi:MAG: hypothetical protein AAGF24_03255 [Cyanobacteria bacterium P01_H01_bin.121]
MAPSKSEAPRSIPQRNPTDAALDAFGARQDMFAKQAADTTKALGTLTAQVEELTAQVGRLTENTVATQNLMQRSFDRLEQSLEASLKELNAAIKTQGEQMNATLTRIETNNQGLALRLLDVIDRLTKQPEAV